MKSESVAWPRLILLGIGGQPAFLALRVMGPLTSIGRGVRDPADAADAEARAVPLRRIWLEIDAVVVLDGAQPCPARVHLA